MIIKEIEKIVQRTFETFFKKEEENGWTWHILNSRENRQIKNMYIIYFTRI